MRIPRFVRRWSKYDWLFLVTLVSVLAFVTVVALVTQ